MKHIVYLLLPVLVAGCVSQPPIGRLAASGFEIKKESVADDQRKELEKKLNEVLDFCQPRLSGYELKAEKQASNAYWLSMSGLVAGAVIAPALAASSASSHAAAISAFSGWSGATNFASDSLRSSGLSGATVAETRNKIITSVRDQIVIAADTSKSFDDRSNALMKARADCVMYEIAVPTIPNSK